MPSTTTSTGAGRIAVLARKASRQGMRRETLAELVEAASEEGATRALNRIGLHDEEAGHDIRELRDLLEAWRKTKSTAWHTFIRWMTTIFILLILAALALKLKLPFFNL